MPRTLAALFVLVVLVGCGSQPTSPTPTPTVVQFQGVWTGSWSRQQCSEAGGAVGVGCNTFPLSGGLRLTLTQSGASAQGTLELGSTQIPVTGVVDASGVLRLTGQGRQGGASFNVSAWQSTVSGSALSGTFVTAVIPDDTSLGTVTFTSALQDVVKTA